jgi:hypothetical protein
MSKLELKEEHLRLIRPYPDIVWIEAMFTFETRIGLGSGIFRLIPQKDGGWKAHCVFTNLEDLKDFPEKVRSDIAKYSSSVFKHALARTIA